MKQQESALQQICIQWFRYQYQELSKMLFAVPNGGFRNQSEAIRMKREGVTPGVSDLILLLPNSEFSSLCIEMKFGKGKQSDLQKEWQIEAEKHGNKYIICNSFESFKVGIEEYLKKINQKR